MVRQRSILSLIQCAPLLSHRRGFARKCGNCVGGQMSINDLLLSEFDEEVKKTRTVLERVPVDKKDFTPHAKSMPLGRLAPHVAELTGFGLTVLTTPGLDFSQGTFKPLALESTEQLVRVFDEDSAKVRPALQDISDGPWKDSWKLS